MNEKDIQIITAIVHKEIANTTDEMHKIAQMYGADPIRNSEQLFEITASVDSRIQGHSTFVDSKLELLSQKQDKMLEYLKGDGVNTHGVVGMINDLKEENKARKKEINKIKRSKRFEAATISTVVSLLTAIAASLGVS